MNKIKLNNLTEFDRKTYYIINDKISKDELSKLNIKNNEYHAMNSYLLNKFNTLQMGDILLNPYLLRAYDFIMKFPHLIDDTKVDEIKRKSYQSIPQLENLIFE